MLSAGSSMNSTLLTQSAALVGGYELLLRRCEELEAGHDPRSSQETHHGGWGVTATNGAISAGPHTSCRGCDLSWAQIFWRRGSRGGCRNPPSLPRQSYLAWQRG